MVTKAIQLGDIKIFDRWSVEGIAIEDPGLVDYISLDARVVPRTGAKYAGQRFHKSRVSIVERFMNRLMVPGHKGKKHFRTSGHITGKAQNAYKMMLQVLGRVENVTKQNPVLVLVRAIENVAPREEIITIEYGGARYPKAVECSPQRRVDIAIKLMTQGSFHKSFNSKKGMIECLTDEIVNAYNLSSNSFGISKKLELERQADSSR